MIVELNPKHGFEVWVNQQLIQKIEQEFKRILETDDIYYYYSPCRCDKANDSVINKVDVKWVGKISLTDFIKKVQRKQYHFCPIGVTNASNKKDLLHYLEHDFYHSSNQNIKHWDYWIGDVVGNKMVCGDELFISLWNRVREQKTKGSTTRKKYFFE